MSTVSLLLIDAAVGYLLGSIPAAYIAGRMAGVDIRKEGSGNVGATNVVRTLGKRYGYPVFVVDLLKGVIAVLFGKWIVRYGGTPLSPESLGIVAAVACVIGHNFPIWLGFKGGKGVATSIGVVLGMMPLAAVIILVVWAFTFQISRYVSVASIGAAVALPIVVALYYARQNGGALLLYFSLILAALVVVRHRTNIARLARGTEPRARRR